ncbi:predicted protein [Histoplasma capsulatum var. duboisii H88]|uniref:Predicted protein n=1 Tax=Ajellomyces capsulatus (strain H88) TaxID=544711 RepID=F0UL43_AJEC8|nr:predicted protein [Histoplasma capsulatum var. duboisii H88]
MEPLGGAAGLVARSPANQQPVPSLVPPSAMVPAVAAADGRRALSLAVTFLSESASALEASSRKRKNAPGRPKCSPLQPLDTLRLWVLIGPAAEWAPEPSTVLVPERKNPAPGPVALALWQSPSWTGTGVFPGASNTSLRRHTTTGEKILQRMASSHFIRATEHRTLGKILHRKQHDHEP